MMRTSILLLFAACVFSPVVADDGESGLDGFSDPDQEGTDSEAKEGDAPDNAKGPRKPDGDEGAPALEKPLQERVNAAIKNGVEWLKKRQGADGSWGPVKANRKYDTQEFGDFTRDPTGPTSFSVYALSKCGVSRKDPVMVKGINWVKAQAGKPIQLVREAGSSAGGGDDAKSSGSHALTTYELASVVLMIEAVNTKSGKLTSKRAQKRLVSDNPNQPPKGSPFTLSKDKSGEAEWDWMHECIQLLTTGIHIGAKPGRSGLNINGNQNQNGGWRYGQAAANDQDLSATQFVLLAFRAASQAGFPVEKVAPKTWEWAANFVKQAQVGEGGFAYRVGEAWSAGMDACGVGSLLICKEQLQLAKMQVPPWIDGAIEKGIGHLDQVFSAQENKGYHDGSSNHFYYLYAVERVGDLTGRKVFNQMDWYVRGATMLCDSQAQNGSWTDSTTYEPRDVLGTCFALLFLKRATIPVITTNEE